MAKPDVLERVAADLASGHTQPAIQRLSSLVFAHPADLDLRRRLASVHRMIGNRIEAGRWTYLHHDADPDEVAAFERAFPSPRARLRQLRWRTNARQAPTEFARTRLEALTNAVGVLARPTTITMRTVAAAALLAVIAVVSIVGAVTVAQWM